MRHIILGLCLAGAALTAGCQKPGGSEVDRAVQTVNAIDDNNLSNIMLTVADPNEAVAYFTRASKAKPDRIDLQRGLAKSLVRARRMPQAVTAWRKVTTHSDAVNADRVALADAMIRSNDWTGAEAELNKIPPTHETYDRYRLEAMIADSKKQWKKADSFYETALGLTTTPAAVLNNWGYSKLTRGSYGEAERLFADALARDSKLYTAKNNLVLARGAQRQYTLPVVPMTQIERAQLLHTLALTAIKQGDLATGKGLLQEAIDTHPQHFEEAVRSLRSLEANVRN